MRLTGDCREVLRSLPTDSAQCCVTSPPYWGLRDYDVPGQLGLEATPEEYVANMVEVFRLVREVLRDDGTLWLNLGDSYATSGVSGPQRDNSDGLEGGRDLGTRGHQGSSISSAGIERRVPAGLKPKDLVGIPWRVAFALQADGWYLRSDIIWHKPNPMPESVRDRPTKAHEYVFLFSKNARYYYDADAVREKTGLESAPETWNMNQEVAAKTSGNLLEGKAAWERPRLTHPNGRGLRTVWTIQSEPFHEAHFATFPRKLVEPCILAGTSEKGHCPECGARWARVVEWETRPNWNDGRKQKHDGTYYRISPSGGVGNDRREKMDLGFHPICDHNMECVPDIVLDPFLGSGTTAQVAQALGRDWIGIDLNHEYAPMQERRVAQLAFALSS